MTDVRPAVAVLFDMDGLLVDSEPLWSVAEAEIMAWLGGPWNLEVKAMCLGQRVDEACVRLVAVAGSAVDPGEVADRLVARVCELYRQGVPWLPGAAELLAALADRGVPTALVSSSYRIIVDTALERMGHRFQVTVAGDEVTRGKPDPEPYVRAAAALGAPPSDCVVIEDAPAGVAAGEAAGCVTVVVPRVVPVEQRPDRPALSSLAEVDVDWLLALPAVRRAAGREPAAGYLV